MPFPQRTEVCHPIGSPIFEEIDDQGLSASGMSILSRITQDEEDAIWRETRESLQEIYLSFKARSGRWSEIGRKMGEVLSVMEETETCLGGHPGRGAAVGSSERLYGIPLAPHDHDIDLFSAVSWFVNSHGTSLDADEDNRQNRWRNICRLIS